MEEGSTPQFDEYESTSTAASRAMEGNRGTDTEPELLLRKTLWHRGYRYRKNYTDLPGNPDIVFLSAELAVFIDGDFWHGRNWSKRKEELVKGENSDYWVPKIAANRERDARYNRELREMGWSVVRIWGTDIKEDPEVTADYVEHVLERLQDGTGDLNWRSEFTPRYVTLSVCDD